MITKRSHFQPHVTLHGEFKRITASAIVIIPFGGTTRAYELHSFGFMTKDTFSRCTQDYIFQHECNDLVKILTGLGIKVED